MKLKLLLLSVLGTVTIANAQFTVTDPVGNEIQDGDILEFADFEGRGANIDFFVTNDNSSQEIYTRIEVMAEANSTTGSFAELCYGLCLNNVVVGDIVPPVSGNAFVVGVGETSGLGNHFFNDDPGNGTENVDFVFAFRQYQDEAGTIETGTPLTFTYRYNPTLSVNNVSKVNLSLISTMVTNQLTMDINEPVQVKIYDMQGKLVKEAKFEIGRQVMDVSSLSSQQYIVQFKNEGGAVKTSKIIIK